MPLGQAVLTQAGVAGVVAVTVEKTGLNAGGSGIAMDVAERVQVRTWSSLANPNYDTPLPEVSRGCLSTRLKHLHCTS